MGERKIFLHSIFSILYKLFKVNYKEVKTEVRGFSVKNTNTQHHLERIGSCFLDGYHHSLEEKTNDKLIDHLEKTAPFYRGFAYEGAAMGLAIKGFFQFNRNQQLQAFLQDANHHIYMLHVGVGWALAKLPVRLQHQISRYDPLLRWLIMDGYGFHQIYFKTKAYAGKKKVPRLPQQQAHIFYQGLGRGLWFVCGAEVDRIIQEVAQFPQEYQADIWAGIGLASTYAGTIEESEMRHLKQHIHPAYVPDFLQGIAFAAKARIRAGLASEYTHQAAKVMSGFNLEELAMITDEALVGLDAIYDTPLRYMTWKSNIKHTISQRIKDLESETLFA